MDTAPGAVQFLDNGDISVNVSSVADAKLAIKHLKLYKKHLSNAKREVQQSVNAINAERRDHLAGQGRMLRGGGTIGQLARTFEGMTRDKAKATHEQRLDPYQREKAALDERSLQIDQVVLQLEAYIHEQG